MKLLRRLILAVVVFAAVQTPARSQEPIPYVPSTMPVVAKMLELASVTKDDIVYDMGCGDGRILIMAAKKYGARGVGIDLDPVRIAEAKKNAEQEGVSHLVEFRAEDGTKTDISKATVVTLYLGADLNRRLRPKLLAELAPGSRVVSHDFDMGDWKPDRIVRIQDDGREHVLYLWIIPPRS